MVCVLVAMALLGNAALCAEPVTDAKKRAKEEDKALVVYFFSRYCGYCEAMDKDVLNEKEVNALLKRDTVYVRIDVDKDPETARKHNVRGFPTTLLVANTGKTIGKIPGYIPREAFKKILLILKGRYYETMSLGDFLQKGAR